MEDFKNLLARADEHNKKMLSTINDINNTILNMDNIIEELKVEHLDNSDVYGVLNDSCLQNTTAAKKYIRQLYEKTKEEFKDFGTEISINGRYTIDKDEWIAERDEKAIRYAISRWIKDTGRKINPKMVCVYEHAGKYHFHGIFKGIPNDCIDYIRRVCNKRCGRIEIGSIYNQDSYIDYMFKSYIDECRIRYNESIDEFIKTNKNPRLRAKTKIELLEELQDYDILTINI